MNKYSTGSLGYTFTSFLAWHAEMKNTTRLLSLAEHLEARIGRYIKFLGYKDFFVPSSVPLGWEVVTDITDSYLYVRLPI